MERTSACSRTRHRELVPPLVAKQQLGFISAAKVPGSVPALDGVIPAYTGDVMAPFPSSILPTF